MFPVLPGHISYARHCQSHGHSVRLFTSVAWDVTYMPPCNMALPIPRFPALCSDPPLSLETFCARFEDEAHELCEDDVRVNRAMARFGAEIVPHGANLLHHCNTGALATVDYGTALGVIYGASHPKETRQKYRSC